MTMKTLTLTDFLLARIAEDEQDVDTIPEWHCTDSARGEDWGSRGDCPLCDRYMFDGTESVTADAYWEHYEDAHRRTRVLAEAKAKRRVVDLYCNASPDGDDWAEVAWDFLCALAVSYADHPDYRDEWR